MVIVIILTNVFTWRSLGSINDSTTSITQIALLRVSLPFCRTDLIDLYSERDKVTEKASSLRAKNITPA